MKNTILKLNKRVLVVEIPEGTVRTEIMNNRENTETILLHFYDQRGCFQSFPISEKGILKEICKGSELSEEIAKDYLLKTEDNFYADYKVKYENVGYRLRFKNYIDSFISGIEANGYYWKDNPEKNKAHITSMQGSKDAHERFMEAESKTFHPEQCLIFEIL